MLPRLLPGVLVLLLVAGCAPAPQPTGPPVLRVAPGGAGNVATVSIADGAALVEVISERGLGELTVVHLSGSFPTRITLRLPVAGLEELSLAYHQQQIIASVASTLPHNVTQRLRTPDGSEAPLEPGQPRWIAIEVSPEQPFPLDDGQFTITLPPDLIAAAPHEFTIRWIDFFR